MIVMKFGGTSVGSAERIAHVAALVKERLSRRPILVVSAVAGVTDALIALARAPTHEALARIRKTHDDILAELKLDASLLDDLFAELSELVKKKQEVPDAKTLDAFQSFGERFSARILAAQLQAMNVAAQAFDAWDVGMITDGKFSDAVPLPASYAAIKKNLSSLDALPVLTGFIGKTANGDVTTLGRGGSDYTASIVGAAAGAEEIQIWKEVDGVLSTDPRIVPEARIVPELAFEEVCELAYFGAKVLQPKSILPAMKKNVPVRVLNTFKPDGKGTTIVSDFAQRWGKSRSVEALICKKRLSAIHIHSPDFFGGNKLMAKIFALFEKHGAEIDVVAISVVSASVTIAEHGNLSKILPSLEKLGNVDVVPGKAVICAVGGRMDAAAVVGKMFTLLGSCGIAVEMISQAAGGVSIEFMVDEKDAEEAVRVLHKAYIDENARGTA